MPPAAPLPVTIEALRERIRRLEQPVRHGVLPFGAAAIDNVLPGGGLLRGAMHEILGAGRDEEDAAAPAAFAAAILARLTPASVIPGRPAGPNPEPMNTDPSPFAPKNDNLPATAGAGPILWCLKRPDLYGPGLLAHGLDPSRLVLVTARRDDELLWAIEEGLRAPGLAAVVGEIGPLPMIAARRLQLAAERSGVTLLLLRRWRNAAQAAAERNRPTAAATSWRITALSSSARPSPAFFSPSPAGGGGPGWGLRGGARNWGVNLGRLYHPHPNPPPPAGEGTRRRRGVGQLRWQVELLRCRGGVPAQWIVNIADVTGIVEVADATDFISLSAGLADRPAAPHQLASEPRHRRAG